MPDDAAARYQRVSAAVATLGELADGPRGARLARVLSGDEVILARMRAAAAALGGMQLPAGLPDLPDDDRPVDLLQAAPDDLLQAAVGWQRHARTCGSELERACAADVARGMLRLWARRRGTSPGGALGRRVRQRQARVVLLGLVAARCAALRAELREGAAVVTRRGLDDFGDHAIRRVREVGAEVADEIDWTLPGAVPEEPDLGDLPVWSTPAGGDPVSALFGVVFGLGSALTLGRFATALAPGWAGAAVLLSAAIGVALAGWVLGARRLMARRAALGRWVIEVVVGLRSALEQHIALRSLAAEAAEAGAADGRGDRPMGSSPVRRLAQ